MAAQEGIPGSALSLCRDAILARTALHTGGLLSAEDSVRWDVDAAGRLVAERGSSFTLVVAMGDEQVPLPPGRLLISSAPLLADGRLAPDSAAWLQR